MPPVSAFPPPLRIYPTELPRGLAEARRTKAGKADRDPIERGALRLHDVQKPIGYGAGATT